MLIELLSTSNYVSYNIKLAELLGLHSAIYISELMNINEKAIKKQYESFYKILMEQKSTLQETLLSLVSPSDTTTPQKQQTSPLNNSISTDFLAGTWFGEKNINKVVLMRSGRGFVIYNNGASMNINIKIEAKNSTNKIIITTDVKSFLPLKLFIIDANELLTFLILLISFNQHFFIFFYF